MFSWKCFACMQNLSTHPFTAFAYPSAVYKPQTIVTKHLATAYCGYFLQYLKAQWGWSSSFKHGISKMENIYFIVCCQCTFLESQSLMAWVGRYYYIYIYIYTQKFLICLWKKCTWKRHEKPLVKALSLAFTKYNSFFLTLYYSLLD